MAVETQGTGIMKSVEDAVDEILNPNLNIEIEITERKRSIHEKWREYSSVPKIYIWTEGESLMNNLMNRKSRPFKFYRKMVLPEVFKQLGWPADTKVRWSQYAGCTCPCSPGFRVHSNVRPVGIEGFFDIHVTISIAGPSEAPAVGFKF